MQNFELILSLAGTAVSLFVACLTTVLKLVKNVRLRHRQEGVMTLLTAVAPIVEIAESFSNYTGAEKKEYVLTKINQFAIENGIEYDADAVSDKIEQLVDFSKQVNKRETR